MLCARSNRACLLKSRRGPLVSLFGKRAGLLPWATRPREECWGRTDVQVAHLQVQGWPLGVWRSLAPVALRGMRPLAAARQVMF